MNVRNPSSFLPLYAAMLYLAALTSLSAHAAEPPFDPGGTLYIEFTEGGAEGDRIRYEPPSGAGSTVDIVDKRTLPGSKNNDSCVLSLNPNDGGDTLSSLLNFSANGGQLGFSEGNNKDNIGIKNKGPGKECGFNISGQSVTLTLGDDLSGLKAISNSVAFSVKKNVAIKITAESEGGASADFFVRTGTSIVLNEGSKPDGYDGDWTQEAGTENIFNCNLAQDSGPDSAAFCVTPTFQAVWDSLTLSTDTTNGAPDGQWALGSGRSVFDLANISGVLDCGDSTGPVASTAPDGALLDGFGSVRRLVENISNDCGACRPVPYTLSFVGDNLEFIADLRDQTECAAFEYEVTFNPLSVAELGDPDVQRPVDDLGTGSVPPDDTDPQDERAVLSSDFERSATARIPLLFGQEFKNIADPEYVVDVCLGQPKYATSADVTAGSAPEVGDLVELLPPLSGSFPDMSDDPGVQYGCWLDVMLQYGLDPNEIEPGPASWTEVEDRLWIKVRGYIQGDWTKRLAR